MKDCEHEWRNFGVEEMLKRGLSPYIYTPEDCRKCGIFKTTYDLMKNSKKGEIMKEHVECGNESLDENKKRTPLDFIVEQIEFNEKTAERYKKAKALLEKNPDAIEALKLLQNW